MVVIVICIPSLNVRSAFAWLHFEGLVSSWPEIRAPHMILRYFRFQHPQTGLPVSLCNNRFVSSHFQDNFHNCDKIIRLIFTPSPTSNAFPSFSPEHDFKHMHHINTCIDCLSGTTSSDGRYSVSNYTLRHLCEIQITSASKHAQL